MSSASTPKLRLTRIVLFAALFVAFHVLYASADGSATQRWWIESMTVRASVAAIDVLTPSEQVSAVGHRLVSPYVHLSVLNGCEGTESLFLLLAGILATPAHWRHRFRGVVLGILLIYGLNELRVVALYYTFRYYPPLFDSLHSYIAPLIIIAAGGAYLIHWAKPRAHAISVA